MRIKKSSTLLDAVQIARDEQSILICDAKLLTEEILAYADSYHVQLIAWSHCFLTLSQAELLTQHSCIVRHVCVSTEQRDRLRDHAIYAKSLTINNLLPFELYFQNTENNKKQIVCFLGALNEKKGFDVLAKKWNTVIKYCPHAKLLVIGDGKLYDKRTVLGTYGIAKENYEAKFIKYLINDDGTIKENVHFVGTLGGTEKIDMMRTAAVGIVNPRALDETFCLSAVEFEALGIPVVTARKAAYVETIKHRKTGMLFQNRLTFPYYIVYLLKHEKTCAQLGKNAASWVRKRFDYDSILDDWHQLIIDVIHGQSNPVSYQTVNWLNDYKWLREINRILRIVFPSLPSSLWYAMKRDEGKKIIAVMAVRIRRKAMALFNTFMGQKS